MKDEIISSTTETLTENKEDFESLRNQNFLKLYLKQKRKRNN